MAAHFWLPPVCAAEVAAVAVAGNNTLASAGLTDGTLKLYDLAVADASKADLASFKGTDSAVTAIGFLPDSATLLAGSADKVVSTLDIIPTPEGG